MVTRVLARLVAVHFDRNRTHRHESRLGVRAARDVEEEEKQAFQAEQVVVGHHKQQMLISHFRFFDSLTGGFCCSSSEIDTTLARQLQKEIKVQSNSKERPVPNTHYRPHDKQVNVHTGFALLFTLFLFPIFAHTRITTEQWPNH